MNPVHHAHIASELAAGRIFLLRNYQDVVAPEANNEGLKVSAAATIAQKLWEQVNKE